jgi:hypothetical protein
MPPFGRSKRPEAAASPRGRLLLQDDGIVAVCTVAGLPAELLDNTVIVKYVVPTCAIVFPVGDLVTQHNNPPEPRLRPWFGTHGLAEGRFFSRLAELYQSPPAAVRGPLEDLERAVAAIFARGVVFDDGPLPLARLKPTVPPLARVDGADVVFGGHFGQGEYREHLNEPVKYLMAIEPGIRLMHVIDRQLELMMSGAFCFTYICVTRHPFTDQFLASYALLRGRELTGSNRAAEAMGDQGFVIPKQGDIAASLRSLIERDRAIGESHGRVDLVFCVGAQMPRFEPREARQMFADIHFLLRPGGALLIGYAAEPEDARVSGVELSKLATEVGFSGSGSRIHVGMSNLVNPALPVYSFFRKS